MAFVWDNPQQIERSRKGLPIEPSALCLMALLAATCCGAQSLPWNIEETAMTRDGRLVFTEKPWWPRARALKEGESFTMDLNRDGRPDAMVVRRGGHIIEAIDDGGRATDIWNQVSTAYLVSYNGTGLVDRMVAYLDNDGDGKADEMELRYYRDGYLRYAWFGENYDRDAAQIFDLKDWQYAGNNGRNKFRGNLQIYLNKYDPATQSWIPLSECPFAFWDLDGDGHGDIALRASAAPLDSLDGSDTDYANNYDYMWAREATPLEKTGVVNMRLSYNIDPRPRHDPFDRPHYNFGFTAVGGIPYQFPSMAYYNPRRRPPQTVIRLDWKQGVSTGVHYAAQQTGFSWDEARSVWRWEGQFWIFERVFLPNTGGPTHRWNMRREYSGKASGERRIYYSDADKRYHLQDAEQGWMEVGHLVNDRKDLEFRWFDRDGDGYLDTVEVYRPDNPQPVRTGRFAPRARPATLDIATLTAEYNRTILPQAIEQDRRFIDALKQVAADPAALLYESEAGKAETDERRRYCLDIARELHFLKVRDVVTAAVALPYPDAPADPSKEASMEAGSTARGYSLGDSVRYWDLQTKITEFSDEYAAGRLEEAARILHQIRLQEREIAK
jgi:hypothetical protein